MRNLVMRIKQAIKEIEQEKGPFIVKSLVAKDLTDVRWDLVLSADWFDADPIKRLDYLSAKILGDFDIDCMIQFSGIVTYDSQASNSLVETLKQIQEEHGRGKYGNYDVVKSPDEAVKWIIPLNDSMPQENTKAA